MENSAEQQTPCDWFIRYRPKSSIIGKQLSKIPNLGETKGDGWDDSEEDYDKSRETINTG